MTASQTASRPRQVQMEGRLPRNLDDTASTRLAAAEAEFREREREKMRARQERVARNERVLRSLRIRHRIKWSAAALGGFFFLAGIAVTTELHRRDAGYTGTAVAIWVPTVVVCVLIVFAVWVSSDADSLQAVIGERVRHTSRGEIERELDKDREQLRYAAALARPSLIEQRALYAADVANVIEGYRADSRTNRSIHNSLQAVIMIGSAAITAVAALDAELNWQKATIIAIGFSVTLATGFASYYKFRERSYFLQITADAIEEEAGAAALGVGEYRRFEPGQEEQALAHFTQRVEALRNEQRRRQQQLDQPAESTEAASSQSQP